MGEEWADELLASMAKATQLISYLENGLCSTAHEAKGKQSIAQDRRMGSIMPTDSTKLSIPSLEKKAIKSAPRRSKSRTKK